MISNIELSSLFAMPTSFRKDVIILDLDNTLVHSIRLREYNNITELRLEGLLITENYLVFLRPFCMEFLSYCFRKYKKVILWSMGSRPYVEMILEQFEKRFGLSFHEVYTAKEFSSVKDVAQIQ